MGSDPSPSCADATPVDSTVPDSATAININCLRMSRDLSGTGFTLSILVYQGISKKESGIERRADLRQLGIDADGGSIRRPPGMMKDTRKRARRFLQWSA